MTHAIDEHRTRCRIRGDTAYTKAMKLREEANRLLRLASEWEQEAIIAWAKAEQIKTRLPTPVSVPPLDTAAGPC